VGYLTKIQRSRRSHPRQIRLFQGRLTQAGPLTSQELRFRNKQVSTLSFRGHLWLVQSTEKTKALDLPETFVFELGWDPDFSEVSHDIHMYLHTQETSTA